MKKILCSHKVRLVQILPELWLSECCEYGSTSDLKGAVAEARALVERIGGIPLLRDRIEREEQDARDQRKLEREGRRDRQQVAIRRSA